MEMTTSDNGRKMVEFFEGCVLTAYADQRGIPTIGYGHTASVKLGDTCTSQQADEWLAADLATAESAVNRLVSASLNQNQFDALVSLTFNIGQGDFAESTVLKRLNAQPPDYPGASQAILMWDKPGLQRRRGAEKALFLAVESQAA